MKLLLHLTLYLGENGFLIGKGNEKRKREETLKRKRKEITETEAGR